MRSTLLIAALAGAACGVWMLSSPPDTTEQAAEIVQETVGVTEPLAPAAVAVVVLESEAQQTRATLTLRGRTEASRRVEVPAQTTGLVVSEPLRRGTEVEAGQLLCRLNPGVRAAQLAEAEAALAEAEAEAAAARQLNDKGFTANTTLRTRQAQLEAAQAQLDQVEWDIQNLEIFAPFDGVLETDTAELGALMSPGTYCGTVIDLSKIKVTGFVSEQEVDLLSVGQKASARMINGIEATGEITFLSRSADQETRTYAVEATLPNPEGRLRDGMTAELRIELPSETAHLIPQTALTLDDNGRVGVRTAENGIARFHPVKLLRDEPGGFWVSGLPDRADVIIAGQEFVRDGRQVVATVARPEADG